MITVLSVAAVAIAALLAVGWVVATADSAPNLSQLHPRKANPPTEIFAADGTPLGYVHTNTVYQYAASNKIPTRLRQATVAIEDRRFYQHGALDYQGIVRAGVKDLLGDGNALQGASTLTMQLVNNMFIPQSYRAHRDLKYKIVQAKLAEQLESKHSKQWILDSYLNAVPYGTSNGQEAVGVGAAALMFFNRPVSKLNLAQMSLLAGLPQSPSQYDPLVYPQLAKARRTAVLQAMVTSHYISQGLATAVEKQPLQVHPNDRYIQHSQPYIFDFVEQQLMQHFGTKEAETGGLKVYTTIDPRLEQEALTAVIDHEGGANLDAQPAAALATVNPANGNVLAIASSATYAQTKFDYPVQAERQTGSAFKAFALMTLIHDYDGNPNSTYYTSKFLPAGWNPLDPTWSGAHRRGDLSGRDRRHEGDDDLGQHGVRPARGRPRLRQARRDRARDGDHLGADRQPLGGDRRPQQLLHDARDGRRLRDAGQRWARTFRRRSSARSCSRTGRSSTSAILRTTACSQTARRTRAPRS